jgi:hypothetical protein
LFLCFLFEETIFYASLKQTIFYASLLKETTS